MKSASNTSGRRRGIVAVGVILVLMMSIGAAAAKTGPTLVPRLGKNSGELKLPGENAPLADSVKKMGGGYSITLRPLNQVALTCGGGEKVYLTVSVSAPVKDGKFSVTSKVRPPQEVANKSATVTVSGRFTTTAKAVGTLSAKTLVEPGVEGSMACRTGNLKFKIF